MGVLVRVNQCLSSLGVRRSLMRVPLLVSLQVRGQNESLAARLTSEGHVSGGTQHRLFVIAHLREFPVIAL